MNDGDLTADIQGRIQQAAASATPLRIVGGNSKAFYGEDCSATAVLDMAGHSGFIDYEPSELVITARAGTRLRDIETLLDSHGQMLAFEPPYFGEQATLGGTMACGFSGPRRPFAGAGRDFMLGCKIVNGYGEVLSFGGQVMKNVAGFDVSRLMIGALGTLGVLLEISLRVLPKPESEATLIYAMADEQQAIKRMNRFSGQPWPLSALAYDGQLLSLRLSGAESAVQAAARQLGGDFDELGEDFWLALREQNLAFFEDDDTLWRISMAPSAASPAVFGTRLLDWGGALRWLKTDQPAKVVHEACEAVGGYAEAFRGGEKHDRIRLKPEIAALQSRIRAAFDPHGLFNPGFCRDR
ncbi:MAG: glycolate oxidase subunit GlcE [Methylococcaceae bacterium]|nr:glycolate oxidase subunit GlcE [Methylococcaceae bacterium]